MRCADSNNQPVEGAAVIVRKWPRSNLALSVQGATPGTGVLLTNVSAGYTRRCDDGAATVRALHDDVHALDIDQRRRP
jgi:hypothetical protein